MDRIGTLSSGVDVSGWTNDYYGSLSGWLRNIYTAIDVANAQIENGLEKEYTQNLIQIARIWRAYLLSEVSDNFGPAPIAGFGGENPEYASVENVYNYMLQELSEAVDAIDTSVSGSGYKRLGPSLRLRF